MKILEEVTAEQINTVATQMIGNVTDESMFTVALASIDIAQWIAFRAPSPYREALSECFLKAAESLSVPAEGDAKH